MIEINLLEKKKPMRLPVVAGVDLNEVNFKPLIFAYIVKMCVDWFVLPNIGGDISDLKIKLQGLQKQQRKLQADLKKNANLKEMLVAFDKQIAKLKRREAQVEQVLKQKTNPKNILSAVTKIVPDDLWLDILTIDSDARIYVEGGAVSYRSVGELISKANELEFFGGSIVIKDSLTEEKKVYGNTYRLQKFKIEGSIDSFGVLE
jgi:hypothetical protein